MNETNQTETVSSLFAWDFAAFPHSHHGGSFHIAYAHHDNNRNVPDEWISNYQGAPIYHLSGNRQEMFFLTCFPLLEQKVACEILIFLILFSTFPEQRQSNASPASSYIPPVLRSVHMLHTIKKIQNQPAFLNLWKFLYCPV